MSIINYVAMCLTAVTSVGEFYALLHFVITYVVTYVLFVCGKICFVSSETVNIRSLNDGVPF